MIWCDMGFLHVIRNVTLWVVVKYPILNLPYKSVMFLILNGATL